MKNNIFLFLLATAGMMAPTSSRADGVQQKVFEFSGYGTVGTMQTDRNDSQYRGSTLPKRGAGSSPYLGVDSVLGLQARGVIADKFSYMVQSVTRNWSGDGYTTDLTWAALSYEIQPGLFVRVGRVNTPFFMQSDTLFVNHLREWARPPVEVYSLSPFMTMDGVDAIYRVAVSSFLIEAQTYLGSSKFKIPTGTIKLRDLAGARLSVAHENLSVQFSYANSKLDSATKPDVVSTLNPALDMSGFSFIKDEIDGTSGRSSYASAGFRYESDYANFSGEYAKRTVSKYFPSAHAWYLSISKRVGDFTPYYYYAHQHTDRDAIQSTTGMPEIDSVLHHINVLKSNAQRSHVAGLRYDLTDHTALKVEFSRSRPDHDSWGIYAPENVASNRIADGKSINNFSLSVDFVF